MKRILPLSVIVLLTIISISSSAQITVASTTGYMVQINIQPIAIVPTSNSCVNGYNYNIKMNYTVKFTGSNIPANLYTLQGTLGCGANAHFFQLPKNGGTGTVTSRSNVWRGVSDCAVATLSSLSCTQVIIEIHGLGIESRFVSAPANMIVALPVQLISFTAVKGQNTVKLNWTTAAEQNNEFFTIERSANGNEWNAIKTIKGAGNSSNLINYETIDAAPLTGVSYYRLRQTDLDGKSTYSDVRTIENTSDGAAKISLYPVPNTGNTINLAGISNVNEYELNLLNTAGSLLFNTKLSKNAVELPSLKAGLYIIVVKNKVSGEASSFRYVKI